MSPPETTPDESAAEAPDRRSSRRALLDLTMLAVPAAAWFLHLNVSYVLVPPSCRAGHRWFLAAVTVVALAAVVPSGLHALRARGDQDPTGLGAFLGPLGVWVAAIFASAILLVGLSALVVGPCR